MKLSIRFFSEPYTKNIEWIPSKRCVASYKILPRARQIGPNEVLDRK